MAAVKLTNTQQKFFDLMADGQRHSLDEFVALLNDELSGPKCVQVHMVRLRKAIADTIEDVVCERIYRRTTYRRVRKLYKDGE